MTTAIAVHDLRKLLFISYAYEDQVFAKWLARKLAFYGYGVWIDQIEILGGESWVKEVDIAIKDRSFRVLAILSKASIAKDNPRKERTLALQLGKQRKTDDFLITLNLDGSQPDWTLADISWISFQESWADGLRRLLKKLESAEAPKIHDGNSAIAKAALERGASLLSKKSEALTTIRYVIRKTDMGGFVIQLRPGVALLDGAHKPITGRKVGPRTKKVTRAYFNEKWRKRLMAFSQLLAQSASEDKETVLRLGSLVTLNTDWSLDETSLTATATAEVEEPAQDDVHVSPEEMEDGQDE